MDRTPGDTSEGIIGRISGEEFGVGVYSDIFFTTRGIQGTVKCQVLGIRSEEEITNLTKTQTQAVSRVFVCVLCAFLKFMGHQTYLR